MGQVWNKIDSNLVATNIKKEYELRIENKDDYDYPVDGWTYFDKTPWS